MWFKNLCLFQLSEPLKLTPAELEEALRRKPLTPCSGQTASSRGWVPPRDEDGNGVEALLPHLMIALGTEQKLLPASVINEEAKERARDFEAQRGYKPGRKQMRDIKDELTATLLPRAFSKRRLTRAWLDGEQRWLVVDAASATAAEELVEYLRDCVPELPSIQLLEPKLALSATLSDWLGRFQAPGRFSIDDECELTGTDPEKSSVRYLRHALNTGEIRQHITHGKRVAKLGLTWNDKLSFVVHDNLQIKKLKFLEMDRADDAEGQEVDEAQQFEIDFSIMSGELRLMLGELCEVAGVDQ